MNSVQNIHEIWNAYLKCCFRTNYISRLKKKLHININNALILH